MHKENNNNIIYSTILLPDELSSAILESTREHNQRNQRCLRSACAHFLLNVNNADYVDYVSLLRKITVEPLMSHGLFYRCPYYVSVP